MADFLAVNRDHWDGRAEAHARSRYYDLTRRPPAPAARTTPAGPGAAASSPAGAPALFSLRARAG